MKNEKIIAIIGALHGDERVGVEVIKRLKKIIDGENIVGIVANEEGLKRGKRFISQDLNRSFPGNPKGNPEERIAYKLTKKIKKFDYVLDLHSFSCKSEPFAVLTKKTKSHLNLAESSGIRKIVLMLPKLASGKALIDYCPCGISIETGRYDLESTFKRAMFYTENILGTLGFLKKRKRKTGGIDYFKIIDVFFKEGDEEVVEGITNFKLIYKGETVASGRQRKVVAPYDFYPVLARERAYPNIVCLAAKRVKIEKR